MQFHGLGTFTGCHKGQIQLILEILEDFIGKRILNNSKTGHLRIFDIMELRQKIEESDSDTTWFYQFPVAATNYYKISGFN